MKKALAIILTVILCVALGAGAWFTYSYLNDQKAEAEKQSEYSILVEDNISINSDESYTLNPYLIKTDGTVSTPRFQYSSSSDCVAIDQNGTITVVNVPDTDDVIQITVLDRNSGETAVVNLTILRSLSNVKDLTFINAKGERKLLPDELAVTWKDSFALDVYTQPQNINVKNYATVTITDLQGKAVDGVISHTFNSNCINLTAVGIGKGYINVVINDDADEVLFSKQIAFSISTKEKYIGNALLAQQNSTVLTETALNNVTTFFLKETVGDISELYCLEALDTIYLDLKRCFVPNTIIPDYCYRVPVGLFYTYTSNAAWNSYVGSIIPFETYNDRFVVYHNEKGTTSQTELFYDKIDDDFALYTCQYTGCVNTGWNDQTTTVTQEDISAIAKNGVHLYAEWRQSEYTVQFVSDEKYGMTAIESEVLEYDQDCTLPTADGIGYNFKYWYVDINENGVFDDGDITYDAAQTVNKLTATDNGLITFVACWSPIEYTVEFVSDKKYGMTAIESKTLEYDQDCTLPTADGIGYNFQHWYVDINGNDVFDDGDIKYDTEHPVNKLTTTDNGTVVLVANWAPIEYHIEFVSDEKYEMTPIAEVILHYDESWEILSAEGVGYNFEYWYVDENGNGSFDDEDTRYDATHVINNLTTTDNELITFVACWSPIEYTVKFVSDEKYEMTAVDSVTLKYEEDYIIPSAKGVGYNFKYWFEDINGNGVFDDGDIKYDAAQTVNKLTSVNEGIVTLTAYWTPTKYTVEFVSDKKYSMTEVKSQTLDYDQYFVLPSAEGVGYNFEYWYVDFNGNGVFDDGDVKYNTTHPVNKLTATDCGTVTLTAAWSPIKYAVKFVSDEKYRMTAIDVALIDYNEESVLPSATGVGYNFEYWYVDANGNGVFDIGDTKYVANQHVSNLTTTHNATITLVAVWTPIKYTVEFVSDEKYSMTSIASVTLDYEEEYTLLPATGVGYTFDFWYIDNNGDNKYDNGDSRYEANQNVSKLGVVHNGTVTLRGAWNPIEYTLVFTHEDCYGANATESITVKYDEERKFPSATATGYEFKYWSIEINGDTQYAYVGDPILKLTTEDGAVITFVSNWEPIKYTIQFVSDDKYGMTAIKPVTLNYNAEPYNLPTATGYGYTFQFWYIDANGNHSFDAGETQFEQSVQNLSSTNGDVVKLSASWAENSYTILFDPFGTLSKDLQSDVILPADFQYEVTLKFSETYTLKRLEKVGYTYRWFIDADGDNEIDEGELTFNAEEPVSKLAHTHEDSITIKAKWTPISYTIAFYSADEYNMDPMDSIAANYDEEYILKKPKAKGYTFVEWKLSEGDVKKADEKVKNLTTTEGATVTLQAIWMENTYTIKFNVKGDDVTLPEGFEDSVELKYSQEYTLPALSKTGYSYYWFVDENGNEVADSNETQYEATVTVSKLIESGEITLTPRWVEFMYTLEFVSDDKYCMENMKSVKLGYSDQYTLSTKPTAPGYIFNYWTCGDQTYKVNDTISQLTKEDGATVTMTANWTPIKYTIAFDSDDKYGMTAISSVTLDYDAERSLPTPTAPGYIFNYWTCGDKTYNAGDTISKLTTSADGTVTLTANWTPISYTLKFASSDSRYGMTAISSVTLNYDQEYTLPGATGVGYTFEYWTYNGKEYKKEHLISKLTTENGSTVTMTANWTVNKYKVTITQDKATITLKANGKIVSSGDYVEYGTSLTVSVTYEKSDNRSFKVYKTSNDNVVVTATNNSTFTMPAYDITASASSSCVATGTLITLADGSQVAVENLTGNEMLLVWNLMTGTFDSASILFVDSDPTAEYEIINLHFSDGTVVKVIDEHGFYDCDLNEYVFLRSDAQKYVGHHFNKQITDTDGNVAWTTVELTDVVVTKERTEAWSPVTYGHLCFYVNGMLSMPGATTGFINVFEVDSSTLQIDYDKYLADIEEYGLFTYEEFCETFDVSEEIFNAFNGQYLKVSIGKGLITYDEIEALIVRYSKFF